uniref:ABC2_membrane_7 domain-containing protein n=1 Tax=Syphacia muris TaxID=451379 RepID=A0A0N5AHG6_9BILA
LRRKKGKKAKTSLKVQGSCCEQADVCSELDYASHDEDVEMDADMMEFFRQTLEHRRQIGIYGIHQPSVVMPNVAEEFESRKKVMAGLYGSNADKVTAMETFLDMRFEQYLDKYKPQLWPSIPLRL